MVRNASEDVAVRLNLGSGTIKLEGFLDVDHRADAGADVVDDAFTMSTVEAGSVDEIVASHILEHACFDRTISILARWREILKPGGKLWVAVPNFALVVGPHLKNVLAGRITWEFFNSRIFGNPQVAMEMYGDGTVEGVPGVCKYELAFHRAVFTMPMLVACLRGAGFASASPVEAIPYKGRHQHEICALAVK